MKWLLKSIVLERWKKKKKRGMWRQSGDERERGKKGDEESGKGEEKRVGDKTSLRSLLYRGWIVALLYLESFLVGCQRLARASAFKK